jgi:hypothetical protein
LAEALVSFVKAFITRSKATEIRKWEKSTKDTLLLNGSRKQMKAEDKGVSGEIEWGNTARMWVNFQLRNQNTGVKKIIST